MRTILAVAVALAACHRPHLVEHRMTMPATSFCAPHQYHLPAPHEFVQGDPWLWVSAAGIEIDKILIAPRRPDWSTGTGDVSHRYDLPNGRWLILVDGERMPGDPPLDGYRPQVAYVWNPGAKDATFIGRTYWAPYVVGAFLLAIQGSQIVFADVDPAAPVLRPLGVYTEQSVIGASAGTAVLWTRTDTKVAVSCLGDTSARHVTVPVALDPANDSAVRDQRVLLQTSPRTEGRTVTSELWVLDLDLGSIRFIGTAVGGFEDAHTNIPRVRAVSRAGWTNTAMVVPLGYTATPNDVDPATESIAH